ncbi:hypothetical protein LEP1GSC047_0432 [Leptospira inadai serovar Lyme str. 10]|uniref:Uncharacterized protein n=1 Tax=Leptospira inadai serovar Lyme str. 10 TaxID=1049790 RepID=V6HA29_9LEPT|nr:hypothetical protein LEP1GSC047_0432 [Leptospira inadai serovar Lyme str. 10]
MPSTGPNTVYFLSAIGTVLVESPALEVAQAERIPIKAVIIRILANRRGIYVFPLDETDLGLEDCSVSRFLIRLNDWKRYIFQGKNSILF